MDNLVEDGNFIGIHIKDNTILITIKNVVNSEQSTRKIFVLYYQQQIIIVIELKRKNVIKIFFLMY